MMAPKVMMCLQQWRSKTTFIPKNIGLSSNIGGIEVLRYAKAP
jgi:hypothetical protein